jgi:hypothetical protein
LPEGEYQYILWYPENRFLVFQYDGLYNGSVEYTLPDRAEWTELPLQKDGRCSFSRYYVNSILPDGRLGLIHHCYGRWPENDQLHRNGYYLAAYDWESGLLEQVVEKPLSNRRTPGYYSWNPDMTRGIQQVNGNRGTLWWITPEGTKPLTVTLKDGSRSWVLADNVAIMESTDDEIYFNEYDVGTARSPAWSSDGQKIAFLASLDAYGRSGLARILSEYKLYLMDPQTLEPQAVLEGIYEPGGLFWSPDSEWVAFSAGLDSFQTRYLILFSPSQKRMYLVPGNFGSLAWSPTGTEIAAIHCLAEACRKSEVLVYSFQKVLRGADTRE